MKNKMKKIRQRLSTEKINKIYYLHAQGLPNSRIANETDVSISTIRTYLKIKNLKPHHKLTREGILEEITEFFKNDKTIKELAFLYDVSYSTIVLFLKNNGLK